MASHWWEVKETHERFWSMVSIILAVLMVLSILRHDVPPPVEGCSSIATNSEGAKNVVVRCLATGWVLRGHSLP